MHERAAPPDRRDGLRGVAAPVLLPLLVWAGHFGFCYLWLAVTCTPELAGRQIAGTPLAVAGLVLVSLGCVGVLGWLLSRAAIEWARPQAAVGMAAGLRLGSSALALIATLWTTLPMFFVPACDS